MTFFTLESSFNKSAGKIWLIKEIWKNPNHWKQQSFQNLHKINKFLKQARSCNFWIGQTPQIPVFSGAYKSKLGVIVLMWSDSSSESIETEAISCKKNEFKIWTKTITCWHFNRQSRRKTIENTRSRREKSRSTAVHLCLTLWSIFKKCLQAIKVEDLRRARFSNRLTKYLLSSNKTLNSLQGKECLKACKQYQNRGANIYFI